MRGCPLVPPFASVPIIKMIMGNNKRQWIQWDKSCVIQGVSMDEKKKNPLHCRILRKDRRTKRSVFLCLRRPHRTREHASERQRFGAVVTWE